MGQKGKCVRHFSMESCREGNEASRRLGEKLILKHILSERDVCEFMGVKVVSGVFFWNQL